MLNLIKRLSAAEITRVLESWKSNYSKTNSKFYKQFKRIERVEKLGNNLMSFSYQTHPQAIYTSRLLEFKSLPEPQNSQEINDQFYSNSLQVNFMKLNLLEEKDEEIATVNFRATAKTEKLITRNKRQLSLTSQNEPLPLTKSTKLTSLLERVNIEEKQEFQPEPMEIDDNNQDWRNINSNFTDELIHSWQSHRFSPSQTQDWLSIGLQPTDSHLAAWLRDELRLTPEQLLNDHTTNLADLREQFTEYQTYQEQPPKN